MEDLKKNQKFIFLIAGCLAFLFMAFLPAVDIMGKESANGFKFVFEATGGGFSRFTMLLLFSVRLPELFIRRLCPR